MNHLRRASNVQHFVRKWSVFKDNKNFMHTTMSVRTPFKYETLALSVPKPFVYHVELNRPDKRNALSDQMWTDIQNCFESISEDEECRVVVLSGAGPLFCAGIDLQCFLATGQNFKEGNDLVRKSKVLHKLIKKYQNSLSSIEKCAKPVLCAIHNGCIGAGVDMITAADIRYCTSDAWFQIKEIDIGMAADVGTIQRFPKIIGSSGLARELAFTGRKFSAEEAKQCGLVNDVYESKDSMLKTVIGVAEQISYKSPVAVQNVKKSLIYSRDHSVEEGLEHIATLNQYLLQSDDLVVGITAAATKSKEPAQFSKL